MADVRWSTNGRPVVLAATLLFCGSGCLAARVPVGLQGHQVASFYAGPPMRVVATHLAPASEPVAPSDGEVAREHRVEKGETLWRISRRYGLSVEALMSYNGLADPTELRAGMRLRIPSSDAAAAARRLAMETSPAKEPKPAKVESERSSLQRPPQQPAKEPVRAPSVAKPEAPKPEQKVEAKPASESSSSRYPLMWPVEGALTSRFGKRWGRAHDGIDIGADAGTPVRAAAAGKVLFAAPHGSYGNLVVLKHADGLITVYAHNQINLVRKGQTVSKGQTIGKVGQTGRAKGPHLHFEVRKGTTPQNPLSFLPP